MLTLKIHLMRHLVRYIIIAILVIAGFHTGMAQTVRYLHKPLSPEGCHVEYNVSKQDSAYFIIVSICGQSRFHFIFTVNLVTDQTLDCSLSVFLLR